MNLDLDEGDRQMVLLALAKLSIERPGWDNALNDIAKNIDNVFDGRALMYDGFRRLDALRKFMVEDGELFIQHGCRAIVFPGAANEPAGVSYVRVIEVDQGQQREIAYWDSDEWRDAPEEVMGAILGAFFEGARGDE